MTKINVSELEGAALDYAVAMATGEPIALDREFGSLTGVIRKAHTASLWHPSTDWSQGGPLIDQLSVAIDSPRQTNKDHWQAQCWDEYSFQVGPTPLIAAMRAIVAAEIGDTVEVPADLV